MGFRFECFHMTLAHSKGQGQGHAHFDSEYLVIGNRYCKHNYCQYMEGYVWPLDCHIYIWPWTIPKVNSRSFLLRISFKWWRIFQTLLLPSYSAAVAELIKAHVFIDFGSTVRKVVGSTSTTNWTVFVDFLILGL